MTIHELENYLYSIVTPSGIEASADNKFRGAIFGRDTALVGLDLAQWYPDIARRAIISLAKHQGAKANLTTEEEPGKIHHEYRPRHTSDPVAAAITADLYRRWKVNTHSDFTSYVTVDATPQYVRLIAEYVNYYGNQILNESYERRDGSLSTIKDSLIAAVDWIVDRLKDSELGLLEFKSANPTVSRWQVLRDGVTSYLDTNGKLANFRRPIASIEVQGLAYDALMKGKALMPDHPSAPVWEAAAALIPQRVLGHFWLRDQQFFAMAVHRGGDGRPHPLGIRTSLPGELLETGLLDALPPRQRKALTQQLVNTLFSEEFLTPVGLRMRSLRYLKLLPYADYQGVLTCWPVATNIVAKGLHRQGLCRLGRELEQRLMSGVQALGPVEYFYVDELQRVVKPDSTGPVLVAQDIPQNLQAWTISAVVRIKRAEVEPVPPTTGWRRDLEAAVFKRLPRRRIRVIGRRLDSERGAQLEQALVAKNS